jgi:hypothetical protein
MIWEVKEGKRPDLLAGELAELCVKVTVGGENVFRVEAFTFRVALRSSIPLSGSSSSFFASSIATGNGLWPFGPSTQRR